MPLAVEPWSRFTPPEYEVMVRANFDLMAHARTDVPRLCEALRATSDAARCLDVIAEYGLCVQPGHQRWYCGGAQTEHGIGATPLAAVRDWCQRNGVAWEAGT